MQRGVAIIQTNRTDATIDKIGLDRDRQEGGYGE
jgi:hypothetical protein